MKTDELINALVVDLRPTPPLLVAYRLAIGISAGALVSTILLFALMGPRHDLADAVGTAPFWTKAAFTLAMAAASLTLVARLARPGAGAGNLWIMAVPLLAYMPFGIAELIRTDRADWVPMLLGHGWRHCTWLVFFLSLPVFAGVWWSFKRFAPTRFELSGAVAGICSGAVGAVVYCFHCPTDAAVFALTWYTLAFALSAGLGALLGRRILHWRGPVTKAQAQANYLC
jgi:hypothetical protein